MEITISLFYTGDGDSGFLRNVGKILPDYTESHPRRQFIFQHFEDLACNMVCAECFSATSRELRGAESLTEELIVPQLLNKSLSDSL
jgi:hypothetical protein